jgi:hypothetical protein
MATNYGTAPIVQDGLYFCIDPENLKSYPGTGPALSDLSGNGFNFTSGSAGAGIFTTDAKGRKCFDLTNTQNKFFQSNINNTLTGEVGALSLSVVVSEESTAAYRTILGTNPGDGTDGISFVSLDGKFGTDHWSPQGVKCDSSHASNTVLQVTWTIDSWSTHFSAASTKIYINGVEQAVSAYGSGTQGSVLAAPWRIGTWDDSRADMRYDGKLYFMAFYNRELTTAEVLQNYHAMQGRID